MAVAAVLQPVQVGFVVLQPVAVLPVAVAVPQLPEAEQQAWPPAVVQLPGPLAWQPAAAAVVPLVRLPEVDRSQLVVWLVALVVVQPLEVEPLVQPPAERQLPQGLEEAPLAAVALLVSVSTWPPVAPAVAQLPETEQLAWPPALAVVQLLAVIELPGPLGRQPAVVQLTQLPVAELERLLAALAEEQPPEVEALAQRPAEP
mmetsp:Transcript_46434/g.85037  ORF Transcript_46434/g.85037 Transcript_46434/m.85037 type:complete len:202 (+) Transcript_46434:1684-2289(+)